MGLWLSSIKTHLIRRDDAAMTLRLMIPWREVIAMGIIEDKSWAATAPIGFKTSPHVTVLTQPGSDD
jgi:hypothetical protein